MFSITSFDIFQIVWKIEKEKIVFERRKREYQSRSSVRGPEAVDSVSFAVLGAPVSFLLSASWLTLAFIATSNQATFAPNSSFIAFKVPSSTSRSKIIFLSSVAHPLRFSHTPLRSVNVYLISPWPTSRLVISSFISLRSSLNHYVYGGGITSRYGWGRVFSMSAMEISSSCFQVSRGEKF